MDHIDRKIIDLLQNNARAPLKEIADHVFLSSPAVSARMARLESSGVHVILSGHLHIWSIGAFQDAAGRTILQVQAGTALCARPHDRQNEFAILEFLGDDLIVERRVAPMSQPGFGPPQYLCFTRRSGRWQSL